MVKQIGDNESYLVSYDKELSKGLLREKGNGKEELSILMPVSSEHRDFFGQIEFEHCLDPLPHIYLAFVKRIGPKENFTDGQSIGDKLVKTSNAKIDASGLPGVLLCDERQKYFYQRHGWKLIGHNKEYPDLAIMTYKLEEKDKLKIIEKYSSI